MRTASEVLRSLEARVARLEGGRTASNPHRDVFKGKKFFSELYELCSYLAKIANEAGVFYQSGKELYMAFGEYLETEQEDLVLGDYSADIFAFELYEVRVLSYPEFSLLSVTLDITGDDGEVTDRPVVLDIGVRGREMFVKEAM